MAPKPFPVGSEVEVTSNEPGFEGSWYEATVCSSPSPSSYVVVYDSLLDDPPGDPPRPLRESARRRHVRPRPPWGPLPLADLQQHQLVEARHNDGWWVGRVAEVRVVEERCCVWFPCSEELIEFGEGEVRRHMVWWRGRWVPPDPEKYGKLPEWQNHHNLHLKEENMVEGEDDILIAVQSTSQALPFDRPSSSSLSVSEVSMKPKHSQEPVSTGKVIADGKSLSKRSPKMRLLKFLASRDFMTHLEQEIGKESNEGSMIEALGLGGNEVENLANHSLSRKRLHRMAFHDTDDKSTDLIVNAPEHSCFSDDIQTSSDLTGTATPMLEEREKRRPNPTSSIHDFKIRNMVEKSSLEPRESEIPVDSVTTTSVNGGSSGRQGCSSIIGSQRKRKRFVPCRVHCSQEKVTGQGSRPRGRPPKESKSSVLPASCGIKESLSAKESQGRRKQSIPQHVTSEGTRRRGRPPKTLNASALPANCSMAGPLSAIDSRWKRKRPIVQRIHHLQKAATLGPKKSGRPQKASTSPGLPAKCSRKGGKLRRRESLTCVAARRKDGSEDFVPRIPDHFAQEFSDPPVTNSRCLERQSPNSVEAGFIWSSGYTIRVSEKERMKVAARQAHCSPVKAINQDTQSIRPRGHPIKASTISMLPGNMKSKDCVTPYSEVIDSQVKGSVPAENCHAEMEQNCIKPAVIDRMRDCSGASCQSAIMEADGDISASLPDIHETASVGWVMETTEIGQGKKENGQLISSLLSMSLADESVNKSFEHCHSVTDRAGDSPSAKDPNACQTSHHARGQESDVPSSESQSGAMRLNGEDSTVPELGAVALPFVKTSPLWESLHQLEAFRTRDQRPHFCPLELCRSEYREGNAIGLMVSFASLVDSVCKLKIADPQSTIEEKIKFLAEFKDHGFNVDHVRTCLEELLRIKGEDCSFRTKEIELESQIAGKEDEVRRIDLKLDSIDKELAELDKAISTLHEEHASVMLYRISTESEVARLKEEYLAVKQRYLPCERNFNERIGSLGKGR